MLFHEEYIKIWQNTLRVNPRNTQQLIFAFSPSVHGLCKKVLINVEKKKELQISTGNASTIRYTEKLTFPKAVGK